MTALELFTALRQCGLVLRPWVDHVRIVAPPGKPCPALLQELLDVLEEYEERTALAAIAGCVSREQVEALASFYIKERYVDSSTAA